VQEVKRPRTGEPARAHEGPEAAQPKLFLTNLDRRVTESGIIRLCQPHGKIVKVDYLWFTTGPRRVSFHGAQGLCCALRVSV
jgi:hypothetical protein